jgi:hypothetical protein
VDGAKRKRHGVRILIFVFARIGAETAVSEPSAIVSHTFDLYSFSPSRLTSHVSLPPFIDSHSRSSPPPQPPPQDTRHRITLLPVSTFPSHFGQRRSTLSRSCTALVRPQCIRTFFLNVTDIFHTFSCPSGATTPGIPTPYLWSRLLSRDSKMYLSGLLSRTA